MNFNILIVNWNGLHYCKDLLSDISAISKELLLKCIIVDNASQDGSFEYIASEFPEVRLIKSEENLGYAKGNNLGLEHCSEKYVFLLNNDTRIRDKLFFSRCVELMEKLPDVAAATPALFLPNGELQVGAAGFDGSLRSFAGHFLFLAKLSPRLFPPLYIDQRKYQAGGGASYVEWVSGACLIAQFDALKKVGGIPTDFFMYAEDIKLCRLLRTEGYKIAYFGGVALVHIHGGSETDGPTKTRWITSTLDDYGARRGKAARFVAAMIFSVGFLVRGIIYIFLGISSGRNDFRIRAFKMWRYFRACF